MEAINRYRGFKVDYLGATNNKPVRIKITDLRYDKSIIVGYSAKGKDRGIDRAIEVLKEIGIEVSGVLWAEKGGVFMYDVLLSEDFTIMLRD